MARAKEVTIGGIYFTTEGKALTHYQAMLRRYVNGQTINEEDSGFLIDGLKRHPRAAEKIGCGVRRFFKNPAPKPNYGKSCFWIERNDGSTEKFSFQKCVTGKDK